jgi:predicted permease
VYVLNIKGMPSNIAVFEAAMPTLLTASVVADEYHLNTKLVNIATDITILAAFVTILFWYLVLTY